MASASPSFIVSAQSILNSPSTTPSDVLAGVSRNSSTLATPTALASVLQNSTTIAVETEDILNIKIHKFETASDMLNKIKNGMLEREKPENVTVNYSNISIITNESIPLLVAACKCPYNNNYKSEEHVLQQIPIPIGYVLIELCTDGKWGLCFTDVFRLRTYWDNMFEKITKEHKCLGKYSDNGHNNPFERIFKNLFTVDTDKNKCIKIATQVNKF